MEAQINWKQRQSFSIPGFSRQEECQGKGTVPTPEGINVEQWYQNFVNRSFRALDASEYLPVFRASDGEFTFVLGRKFYELPLRERLVGLGRHTYNTVKFQSTFYSSGRRGYVETYPFWELGQLRRQFASELRSIASQGILCLNFSDSSLSKPYVSQFLAWLAQEEITVNQNNYYHFYFVYGLLLGPFGHELISGRKIAVFTSNLGGRSKQIISSLEQMGAKAVTFYATSLNQPMRESLNLSSLEFQPDLCLIGAGVGAANFLVQLAPLNCLCIDAGYVLDILGDNSLRAKRPYCVPDELWDEYNPMDISI